MLCKKIGPVKRSINKKKDDTGLFERKTVPNKRHTEKMITTKTIENEANQQKLRNRRHEGNKKKQEGKQKDSNEADDKWNKDNHIMDHEETSYKMLNDSKNEWLTQANQTINQNKGKQENPNVSTFGYEWELCNVSAGTDYIPCLNNEKTINNLHGRNHFEHRERHCPEEGPTCLVPLPKGYKTPIPWPQSRDKVQILLTI